MTGGYPTADIQCSYAGCSATLKNGAWSKIKANWFFQKNGDNWCPLHQPEWVSMWRKQKESK